MRCALAVAAGLGFGIVIGSQPTNASTPPDDPEAVRELEFAIWAAANGVVFHRLSCDVTVGEGDVCFVLSGQDVTAYIPTDVATGWQEFGAEVGTATTSTAPAVQPIVAQPNVYYANCSEARAAGDAPLYRGDPGYRSELDRDDDGVACE